MYHFKSLKPLTCREDRALNPTIYDVSRLSGVSTATACKVLRELLLAILTK